MDWEAIGAIGEVVGAAAVIVTLFYLAIQLRHSKEATESNTRMLEQGRKLAEIEFHRDTELAGPFLEWVAKDQSLAEVMLTGLHDIDKLSAVDRARFGSVMGQWIVNFKSVMESYDRGIMDEETYEIWLLLTAAYLTTPGGSAYWKDGQFGFIEALRTRIEEAKKDPSVAEARRGILGAPYD